MKEALADPADLGADDKARAALGRFRVEPVCAPDGPLFDEAFGALHAEFGGRGEFERREVVARWIAESPRELAGDPPLAWSYALLAARDERGALAGVRDCHVTIDRERRVTVLYLAHALVLVPYRRSGLGALLRAAPLALGRRALEELGEDPARHELLLAAEMDPWEDASPSSIARLVAYGRAGFSAIAPQALPYSQPDFRDPSEIGERPRRLPFLAVVRRPGREGERELPRSLAEAYVRHLHAVFATHCLPRHVEPGRAHALAALASWGARVPLLPLPSSADDAAALAPLSRATVLPFQSAGVGDGAH